MFRLLMRKSRHGRSIRTVTMIASLLIGRAFADDQVPPELPVSKDISVRLNSVSTGSSTKLGGIPDTTRYVNLLVDLVLSERFAGKLVGTNHNATITRCEMVDTDDKPIKNQMLDKIVFATVPAGSMTIDDRYYSYYIDMLGIWCPEVRMSDIYVEVEFDSRTPRPARIKYLSGYVYVARAQKLETIDLPLADAGKHVDIEACSIWIDPSSTASLLAKSRHTLRLGGNLEGMRSYTFPGRTRPGLVAVKTYDAQGQEIKCWAQIRDEVVNVELGEGVPSKIVVEVFKGVTNEKVPFEIRDLTLP